MADNLLLLFRATVSGTYATGDTSIVVDDASRLDGQVPLNLNLYKTNSGTPIDAYEAGNFEVVRVTAVDTGTNTLTVTRAQEGTSAVTIDSDNWVLYQSVNPKTVYDTAEVIVDSISSLIATDESTFTKVHATGFYSDTPWGFTRLYEWDASQARTGHDGWSIINPDHLSTIGSSGWYSSTGDSTDDSGNGCWVRDKGEEITFWEVGAKGDNTNDDTTAIQAAVDSGLKLYGIDGDEYLISSSITSSSDVFISCEGEFKFMPNSAFIALQFDNTTKVTTSLSADVSAGEYDITLTSNTSVEEGDLLVMLSDTLWYYDNQGNLYKGETSVVSSVATDIGLKYSIYDTYDVSAETVAVRVYSPKRFLLNNFDVVYPTETNTTAIEISNYVNSGIDNVTVENCYETGIRLYGCVDSEIKKSSAYKINGSGSGYGVWMGGCLNCSVDKSTFYNCRAGVDFSSDSNYGPSRNCWATKNTIDGSGTDILGNSFNNGWSAQRGLSTHGPAEYCYFFNNTIKNTRIGVYPRGKNIVFFNNEYINIATILCRASHGTNLTFEQNRTIEMEFPDKTTPIVATEKPVGVQIESTYTATGFTSIRDNNLHLTSYLVQIEADIENLYVKDNVADLVNPGTANFINSAGATTISDSSILNNHVYSKAGDSFNLIDSEITLADSVEQDIINEYTYTPELLFGGNNTGMTYTLQEGKYKKDGNLYIVDAEIRLSAKGSSTGTATISLPSTPTESKFTGNVDPVANLSGLSNTIFCSSNATNPSVALVQSTSTDRDTLTESNFTDTSIIRIRFIYW